MNASSVMLLRSYRAASRIAKFINDNLIRSTLTVIHRLITLDDSTQHPTFSIKSII